MRPNEGKRKKPHRAKLRGQSKSAKLVLQPKEPAGLLPEVEVLTPEDYAQYTDASLDDASLDLKIKESRDEIRNSFETAKKEIRVRLLPALAEMRKRYLQPGRRKPVPDRPSWEEYLVSLGLKPDTVRNWFQKSAEANKLTGVLTDGTSGIHPGGRPKRRRSRKLSFVGPTNVEQMQSVLSVFFQRLPVDARQDAAAQLLAVIDRDYCGSGYFYGKKRTASVEPQTNSKGAVA